MMWSDDPDRWVAPLRQAEAKEEKARKELVRILRALTKGWMNVLKEERLDPDACIRVALQAAAAVAAAGDLTEVGRITESGTALAHAIVDRTIYEQRDYEARFDLKDSGEVSS
jgi:hypothetical protein